MKIKTEINWRDVSFVASRVVLSLIVATLVTLLYSLT
jgi:hypothetical protein